ASASSCPYRRPFADRFPVANVSEKANKAHSLSPTNGVLRRIGAIAVGMTSEDGGQLLKLKTKLSTSMTLTQFDNGYWYAAELKEFAETIGIPSANKLRKDELETAIKHFLKTGKIKSLTKRSLSTSGPKDVELGLSLDLPVVVYTNDKQTKTFLDREVQKLAP